MDQKLTGKFIAELRRERGLTQKELAERLHISDKTISKWERGCGLPEVGLMLPLCDELNITVNEMLSGRRLLSSEYQKNAEKNMVKLMKEKSEFKLKIFCEIAVLFITLLATISLCALVEYIEMSLAWRVTFLVIAMVIMLVGVAVCVVLEITSTEYECSKCGERFIPTAGAYIAGPHTLRRRKLKCPKCGERNWCKIHIRRTTQGNNEQEKTQE